MLHEKNQVRRNYNKSMILVYNKGEKKGQSYKIYSLEIRKATKNSEEMTNRKFRMTFTCKVGVRRIRLGRETSKAPIRCYFLR